MSGKVMDVKQLRLDLVQEAIEVALQPRTVQCVAHEWIASDEVVHQQADANTLIDKFERVPKDAFGIGNPRVAGDLAIGRLADRQ